MRLGGWAVAAKWPLVTARQLSPLTVDGLRQQRRRDVKREKNRSKEASVTGLCGLSGPVGILLFSNYFVVV